MEPELTKRERQLLAEIQRLQLRLEEPQQTFDAIRAGAVDAFVVVEPDGEKVYTLKDLHPPYRLIVEGMREGAATVTSDGTLAYCNPQLAEMLGVTRDQLLGHAFRSIVTEEHRALFDHLIRGGEPPLERVELELSASGGAIPVSITATPLVAAEGVSYCLVVSDLREQRHREDLRAAKEAAEQMNRAKDHFLATLSHEVRTPITAILGWIRLMQMTRLDPEMLKQAIDAMHQSTSTLIKIVDDLLDVSRLSTGKLSLQTAAIDLRDVVHSACDAMKLQAGQNGIRLDEQQCDRALVINGDRDRLQQVLLNLLNNAIRFTASGGTVNVRCEVMESSALVSVSDTGEGIAPDFLPYVFERFKQADTSTTRSHKGLGLGLAIVQQLVDGHGGSVHAESEGLGHGATFTVKLPLVAAAGREEVDHQPHMMPSLQGISVLLVDDELETLKVLQSILISAGATVRTARSVQIAIESFAAERADVVVTDVAMPEQDGFSLVRRLREEFDGEIRAIALSAHSMQTYRHEGEAAGFSAFLQKPIEPQELAHAIVELVHGSE